MGSNKLGIIDLGSNTFHILIVEVSNRDAFKVLKKERVFVGLAASGIERIPDHIFKLAVETVETFRSYLDHYGVAKFKVLGTAAFRRAENGKMLKTTIADKLGMDVDIISGDQEADYIFKGVSLLNHFNDGYQLIMDIGGGSTEFIIENRGVKVWSASYDIGVGVLYNRFHLTEPISHEDQRNLRSFLLKTLQPLFEKGKAFSVKRLIGASGSFEVVETMNGMSIEQDRLVEVSLVNYHRVSKQLVSASYDERLGMEGLPDTRAKLIVVAMLLIDVVLEQLDPKEIWISPYALKEGVLDELMSEK